MALLLHLSSSANKRTLLVDGSSKSHDLRSNFGALTNRLGAKRSMPPIDDREFDSRRVPTDLEKQALDFLRKHRGTAYYANEIIEAMYPNEGMILFLYGIQTGLLSASLAPLLEAATARGEIEAAWVRTPNAPILPQRYYRAK